MDSKMFDRYEIFAEHCQGRGIDYAEKYSEPGYNTQGKRGILIANWNDYKRERNLAEKLGYATEWQDEWTTCENCNGLVRTQPNDMSWTKYYTIINNSLVCIKCVAELYEQS